MRVLYFSSRECWPADSGARQRDFYLARELARRAALTYLGFTLDDGPPGRILRSTLEPLGGCDAVLVTRSRSDSPWDVIRGAAGPIPLTVRRYDSAAMRAQLSRLLAGQRYDLVQMEGVHLLPHVPLIRSAQHRPILVCDWHNIESELMRRRARATGSLPQRLYAARTARLLERLERRLAEESDAHLVCSRRECDQLLGWIPRARVHVAPNGVDTDFVGAPEVPSAFGRQDGRRSLVFVGAMDYHANVDAVCRFAREVWPGLYAARPDFRFWVVGSRPAPQVRALASIPGIAVTGTVEDVRPYYRGALAAVAPMHVAGGTRLKVLEAMAAGVPVISTRLGIEGLDLQDGTNVLLADSAHEMAAALLRLAEDEALRQRLVSSARDLARAKYDWQVVGQSLFQFYERLVGGRAE